MKQQLPELWLSLRSAKASTRVPGCSHLSVVWRIPIIAYKGALRKTPCVNSG